MSSNDKITYKGKVKIINDEVVLKEKNKDINYLYQYLSSKDFYSYPELIDENEKYYKYKYYPKKRNSNIIDTLNILALLHKKTSEEKSVNKNTYDNIHDKLKENLNHLKFYYESLITKIENHDYYSPSEYLLLRNISKVLFMMKYSEDSINKWYNLVKNKSTQRVVTNHNNPSVSNTLISDETLLISFDNYTFDRPVLDIYKLYKNENYNTEILSNIDSYININPLSEDEILLFKILITLPIKLKLNNNEINNTLEVKKFIDRVYTIEKFVMKDEKKEEDV